MFISKMHLSRRTVLKGLGVSVGLPLLDAMIPAATALGQTAAAPKPRVTFVYFPHGAVMDQWTPETEGRDFELPPILAPLAPFQKQLTVISGLENRSAAASPVHATTPGTWLRCGSPQTVVEKIGWPSLDIGVEEPGAEGAISSSLEHEPRKVFQRLFGHAEQSVLDEVRHDAARVSSRLGTHDRALLADYLGAVREVELRIQQQQDRVELMFDLIALAYQADLTRVATYMMAAEGSNQHDFHALSHHQNNPAKMERLAQLQVRHTRQFARFVQKLAEIPDGEGSLLEHSFVLYGSNMSNSQLHDHFPLPTAVVGGVLQGNQHLRCPERTPLANLHVALLNKVGVATRSFGDSTGEI